jgi:hypothetical protein
MRTGFSLRCLIVVNIFLGCFLPQAHGQEIRSAHRPTETVRLILTPSDSSYTLPHRFLIEKSDTVLVDSLTPLQRNFDYTIDYQRGLVRFSPQFLQLVFADTAKRTHIVEIVYERYPFQFRDKYLHQEIVVQRDTVKGDTLRITRPATPFTLSEIFGPSLQKSGSLFRGMNVGTNRDLTLSSGFRMELAGKLSSDIEVVAALSDENSPIQPEGNTQTLQEIDKVSVEIKSPNVNATIGDFLYASEGAEFARINRKLQGARGAADYRIGSSRAGSVFLGAVTRGKFNTNQFQGLEGVQGPYRLAGKNGERTIIIIAGTERVYVDGERMTRGETNDYIIDYASGEVTFRPRRLITGASRIVIDFEYTDRFYTRSLLAARTESELGTPNLRLTASYFRESDNENSTIDIALSDSDRAILSRSGKDRFKATKSGVTFVGRDSLTLVGRGQYVQVDTVIDQQAYTFYRYAPGNVNALYALTFSLVGFGQGDYVKESSGNYRWVGLKAGSYLPIQFLPFPELHDLADIQVNGRATDYLTVSGEFAFSRFDANKFSILDESRSSGGAYKLDLVANPKALKIGDKNLGSLSLEFRDRFIDRRFMPIDRTNDVEFNRKWNLESSVEQNEQLREGRLTYQPTQALKVGGAIGRIDRGEVFASTRNEFLFSFAKQLWPRADFALENISSHDSTLDNSAQWRRQRGVVEFSFAGLRPGLRYEGEDKETRRLRSDTLIGPSFRYNEFSPRLEVVEFQGMSFRTEFQIRSEDSLSLGVLQRAFRSFSQTYQWRTRDWRNFSSSVDFTVRHKTFTEEFKRRGNSDVETILMRSQVRYFPLSRALDTDLFYEVATQRSAKLERIFIRVPKGTGNYRYLGDLNGNGIADESEFELTRFDGDFVVITVPTDELLPVIDLKASSRIRLAPSRILGATTGFMGALVKSLSSETYIRIEERSTEKDLKQIYLLHLSRFLNDSTTIVGSKQLTQDLYLFENDPNLSFRFRFAQRAGFSRFALANERSLTIERSIRVRWRMVREIGAQLDVINRSDGVSATRPTNRERDISSTAVVADFSYRPEQRVEVGFRFDVSRATDRFPLRPLTADINDQNIRFVYSLERKGQLRAEVEREEVTLDGSAATLPFELTNGKVVGKTWLWRLSLDYRVAEFIQATVGYDGRSEGARGVVHFARAEVRAFF